MRNGRAVLPAVSSGWRAAGSWWARTYYRDIIELPDALHPPAGGYAVPIGLTPPPPINTPITAYPTSTAPATKATAAA